MSPRSEAQGHPRGRDARWPSEIPFKGWKDVFWRLIREISEDRVMLIAAGATFYLLLALFPALAAFVSLYGMAFDPAGVAEHIVWLAGVLPTGGIEIIEEQLEALVSQPRDALSFGFVFALGLALWSANNGIKTLFAALNVAYDEREKRGFIRLTLITLSFTAGAMLIGILAIGVVGVVPAILAILPLGSFVEALIKILRWPLVLAIVWLAIAVIYRYGPSRTRAQWRWITWGGVVATIGWFIASVGFSFYLENFADYNAVYGSLGAVIGFMMWTWISVTIILIGAEINAEIEHQTAQDSTVGPEKPMGERGAQVADTVGKTAEEL